MRNRIQAHMPTPFHRPAPTLASLCMALTIGTPLRIGGRLRLIPIGRQS